MSETIVVGYDASSGSQRAMQLAVNAAKRDGSKIVLAHVLEWSPYSFLTQEELEERHKRRTEELERADKAIIQPVTAEYGGSGVTITPVVRYGHIAETLIAIAGENSAQQIFIGRTGHSSLTARLFGSVAGNLAQAADCPVTIVP